MTGLDAFSLRGVALHIHASRISIYNAYSSGATMRLTAFTDYGLRALMRLAGEPARMFTTEELASELAISRNHLTKVVRELAGAGLVSTQRGGGGGFRLARPAELIRLGEVVRRLEARHALVECFRSDGGGCTLTPACRLKGRLAAAAEAFLAELDRTSLAECAYPAAPRGEGAADGDCRPAR
ncbi:MAG: Rrf2 family transcriptional regulator [Hyphomicrobiaceae bacterium]|nr:Rrf2 family transcriptional regulator [Hyphomicrobiaceae bacterium]